MLMQVSCLWSVLKNTFHLKKLMQVTDHLYAYTCHDFQQHLVVSANNIFTFKSHFKYVALSSLVNCIYLDANYLPLQCII